jgi:pimeloyl-ACP methyl ester carboxylesterase
MPYFKTRDNVELFYIEGGSGNPIVFVSSAWLSSEMWEFQMPFLIEQGCRCIAYDRRGHGRSDRPWEGYDYDRLADDLAALLEHLDLSGVTLVGHSAGCGEVVRYLTRHGSARVDRIVLACGTTPFPMKTADNPVGVDRIYMEADLALRTADLAQWYTNNAASFFGIGLAGISVSPAQTKFMIQQCLECSPRAAYAFFVTGFTSDLRRDLEAIRIPTLVIHGDQDMQAPFVICGQRTAELVPGSQLKVYENAAHGLFLTHADRFNADLLTFARPHRKPAELSSSRTDRPASTSARRR